MTVGGAYPGEAYPGGGPEVASTSTVDGIVSFSLGALTVTLTGKHTALGTASFSFGGLTLAASGSVTDLGTAAFPLGTLDLQVTGQVVAGFFLGAFDLEIDLTPDTIPGAVGFFADEDSPAPALTLTLTTGLTVVLYDENDQWVRTLDLANGVKFSREVSGTGMVSLALPLDDAADVTAKRFVKVFWRGKCRQAARIESGTVNFAQDGSPWKVFDNQAGVLDLLRDLVVWPEYGIDRTYSTTRTFGYMSITAAIDGVVTNWFSSGNWTHPTDPVRYQDDTGYREFKPAGLSYPNPWWISKNGPYHDEPAGTVQWIRHLFTSGVDQADYQVLATADRVMELWLDGEQLVTVDQAQAQSWTQLLQIKGTLPIGDHVVAAKVRNKLHTASPLALIFTIQQLQKNGDVLTGPPLYNTNPNWLISDVQPGFRASDVLRRCIKENRQNDVAAADLIHFDFDVTADSAGVAWTDTPEQHQFDVGVDVLEVAQQLAAKDCDIEMTPDTFTVRAFVRKGTDRHSTVQIARGDQDTGEADDELSSLSPRFNSVLAQLQDGTWIEETDTASVSSYGKAVKSVSLGNVASETKARKVAQHMLLDDARADDTFTVRLTGQGGAQPFVDFDEGDTVSVQDETGAWLPVRVMSILIDASADGTIGIELEVERDYTV